MFNLPTGAEEAASKGKAKESLGDNPTNARSPSDKKEKAIRKPPAAKKPPTGLLQKMRTARGTPLSDDQEVAHTDVLSGKDGKQVDLPSNRFFEEKQDTSDEDDSDYDDKSVPAVSFSGFVRLCKARLRPRRARFSHVGAERKNISLDHTKDSLNLMELCTLDVSGRSWCANGGAPTGGGGYVGKCGLTFLWQFSQHQNYDHLLFLWNRNLLLQKKNFIIHLTPETQPSNFVNLLGIGASMP